jgi:hypothetical protein
MPRPVTVTLAAVDSDPGQSRILCQCIKIYSVTVTVIVTVARDRAVTGQRVSGRSSPAGRPAAAPATLQESR